MNTCSARPAGRIALVAAIVVSTSVVLLAGASSAPASGPAVAHPVRHPAMISSGGYFSLAVTPAGTVRAWGDDGAYQLGTGAYTTSSTPVTVVGLSGSAPLNHVVEVAAGSTASYALRSDGTVVAWGGPDGQYGDLGNGTAYNAPRPVQVVSTSGTGELTGITSIAAGYGFALALRSNGTVVAWGYNGNGQLGNADTTPSTIPVSVHGPGGGTLNDVVAVSAGYDDAYAVTAGGNIYAWGDNTYGELGNQTSGENVGVPVEVAGSEGKGVLSHVVSVAGGAEYALALLSNGTVFAWGDNYFGQLGDGTMTTRLVPRQVSGLSDCAVSVAAGADSDTSLATCANGEVHAWGRNELGQVGDGTMTDRSSPVQVAYLGARSGVVQLAAGDGFSTAVTSKGAVYDWGDNSYHELGNGGTAAALRPTTPTRLGTIRLPKLFLQTAPKLRGHARAGHTVSVTSGVWGLPATAYAYQWLRDGKAIRRAIASRYRVTQADRRHHLSVRVTASRSGYPANFAVTRAVLVSK